jgi:RNA polymerase sigma-70 factor (ECF subfamily)
MLFNKHYEPLCAFVFGVVKDYDVSEEIVQNLFYNLWAKRNKMEINTSIKSYLYQAARNAALNEIKHLDIKEKYKQYNKMQMDVAAQNITDGMVENELSDTIQKAIDKLPTECKKVFLMSRNEELKYREIAEKLNISIKTVEKHMGNALSKLRSELTEYLPAVLIAIILGIR